MELLYGSPNSISTFSLSTPRWLSTSFQEYFPSIISLFSSSDLTSDCLERFSLTFLFLVEGIWKLWLTEHCIVQLTFQTEQVTRNEVLKFYGHKIGSNLVIQQCDPPHTVCQKF